ncbi:SOS response-associated peptidase [Achromobacter mucicolens]|uniref:SOS response-associated peptidase family protein n=1 Tax=Achromobacter TaxID=222 RepID=UPI001D03390A|nr:MULTISPECIES: SOS response-associated peptidase family protein [Achromobacter]MCU6618009.1 SOS response-associated peptidase [Achromobacter mucicolens]
MCSHYQTLKDAELLLKKFGVTRPGILGRYDMWPRYQGIFVRRPPEHDAGDEAVPSIEAVTGRWGMISGSTRTDALAGAEKLSTFNARDDRVANAFTFRNAWRRAQHCVIPADAIFQPDWRSGKAVATRFTRADGAPLGIAGLWDRYRDAAGQWHKSFTMLSGFATLPRPCSTLNPPDSAWNVSTMSCVFCRIVSIDDVFRAVASALLAMSCSICTTRACSDFMKASDRCSSAMEFPLKRHHPVPYRRKKTRRGG